MIRPSINALWDRWADFHPFVRFLLFVAALALVGLLAVKPGYRAFKAWRLERNLAAAKVAVEDVRMDEARDLSLTVLRAGDPRIEAYRILEKSTASLRDPRHESVALALIFHPEGADEDRLNGFRGIAPEAPLGLVGQIWTQLSPETQQDPDFAAVFADRLIAGNRLGEAASVLLAVPQAARTAEVERQLVRVLIGSGKADGYDEAQRLIAAKFPTGETEASGWLDLLEKIPPLALKAKTLEPIRTWLGKTAGTHPARKALMLARLDYASDFPRRAVIFDEAIRRWKESDPQALAGFLVDLGLYQRLLEVYPPDRLAGHPGLFPLVLDALERTGAWEQVPPLLDAHGQDLPKHELLAHRAMAAARTGDYAGKVREWDAAINEARSSRQGDALLKLSRIAGAAGMQGEAEQALVEAIRRGRGPLPLYSELKPLLNSLAAQGNEGALLEICATYLPFEPGNPVLLTQYSYLACLSDRVEPATILQSMELLGKALPNELPVQMVLATAYLCVGRPGKAADTLDHLKFDPEQLSPSYQVVFLTTQVLMRRITAEDPKITGFPWSSLMPSERRKFSGLIRSAAP
jgi:tetratricopeptide (TPR) repeat protein